MNEKDEKTWGVLTHLAGIIGLFIIPGVGNVLAALGVWLFKRNESVFLDDQGKEALNFQITIAIVNTALSIITFIQAGIWSMTTWIWSPGGFNFGHLFWLGGGLGLVSLLNLVFSIIGAARANNGVAYRYPLSIRLVK
jgi:uncharacterized protein